MKAKYKLHNLNTYKIDTSDFVNISGSYEEELCELVCDYVGAKYACVANNAASIFQIALLGLAQNIPKNILSLHPIYIPSMVSLRIANIVHNSGIPAAWDDSTTHVGKPYVLYDNASAVYKLNPEYESFKIIDSCEAFTEKSFNTYAKDSDIMVFSCNPHSPISGLEGGIMVSNDLDKISYFASALNSGIAVRSDEKGNPEKRLIFAGWELNSNAIQNYIAVQNVKNIKTKNARIEEIRQQYNEAFELENDSLHLYRINVPKREGFIKQLSEKKIQIGIHHGPAHFYPFYRLTIPKGMPKTEGECVQTLSIPFNESMGEKDVSFVINAVKECYEKFQPDS